ncbi:MAG: hypothetical protein U5K72_19830 [Balneolaceae bacterium]|nr:hypothetical protein [Balneolaceae bacterium]
MDRSISDISWSSDDDLYFLYDDEGVTKIGFTDLNGDMECCLKYKLKNH